MVACLWSDSPCRSSQEEENSAGVQNSWKIEENGFCVPQQWCFCERSLQLAVSMLRAVSLSLCGLVRGKGRFGRHDMLLLHALYCFAGRNDLMSSDWKTWLTPTNAQLVEVPAADVWLQHPSWVHPYSAYHGRSDSRKHKSPEDGK